RMLAVKPPACWTAGRVFELLSTQASARGGLNETAQKALTVKPRGSESLPNAVSTTTPLGNVAITSRYRRGSIMCADHHRSTPKACKRTLVCKPGTDQTS